jgi:hypothetical protein
MFTKFELDTITIMVLNRNSTKWFSKESLFAEVSKQYESNMIELYPGHFLFIWSKLLINDNFITVHELDEKIKIKTKTKTNDHNLSSDLFEDFIVHDKETVIKNLSLKDQLNHMIEYPQLYKGSVLIKEFLLKYYEFNLSNFFELYKDTIYFKQKLDVSPSKNNSLNNTINIVVSTTIMSLFVAIGYYYLT